MLTISAFDISNSDKLFFADEGSKFRAKVISKIHKDNEENWVIIDLKKIHITDASFNREAFIKLISSLSVEITRPQILFTNVEEYVKQNMHQSFCYHNMFTVIKNEDQLIPIGKFSTQLYQTIVVISEMKEGTAKEIALKLGKVELTTVNNRLKSLFEMCVITRKEFGQQSGGKEFKYYLKT